MTKFPKIITDYIYLEYHNRLGTTGIVSDKGIMLLDLNILQYNECYNNEEAKTYIGRTLCNYLKNHTSKEKILNDYWALQYMNKENLLNAINTLENNVKFYIQLFK